MAINVPTKVTNEKLSRQELLLWVNRVLQSDLNKIEELCTGTAYCQLMNKLFPSSVAITRVKYRTNLERDYINNFKILQDGFAKMSVNKDIPIDQLVKGRLQDNLEFLKWFKRFFDANDTGKVGAAQEGAPKAPSPVGARNFRRVAPTYTPVVKADRSKNKSVNASVNSPTKNGQEKKSFVTRKVGAAPEVAPKVPSPAGASKSRRVAPALTRPAYTPVAKADRSESKPVNARGNTPTKDGHEKKSFVTRRGTFKPNAEKSQEGGDFYDSSIVAALIEERDFYYSKLCDIEVICHQSEDNGKGLDTQHVLAVLYATREGYAPPKRSTSKERKN